MIKMDTFPYCLWKHRRENTVTRLEHYEYVPSFYNRTLKRCVKSPHGTEGKII